MLKQVYREEDVSRAYVFEWCKWFSERKVEVEFDSQHGHPKIRWKAYER
jgi:hypothetical protein